MKLFFCFIVGSSVARACTFTGACTKNNIVTQCSDISSFSDEEVKQACDGAAFEFGDVSQRQFLGDDTFMDGVGSLNEDTEAVTPLNAEAGRILRFRDNAADHTRVLWPKYEALDAFTTEKYPGAEAPYMDNFADCELRSAVCCFTDTRDSSAITTNAEVCDINLGASRHSSRVYNGFGSIDSNAYCVGMAWASDENHVSNRYKGNMLLDISYGTFLDKGYTKSISGAPLCACIEKMPTITSADCRTLSVTESYTLSTSSGELTITQDASSSITYSDCGDLKSHYNSVNPDATAAFAVNMPDACDRKGYLNDNFWVEDNTILASRYTQAPGTESWTQVAGHGLSYFPTKTFDMSVRETQFRGLVGSSNFKLIYRHCESCLPSHQHIFYKRLTPIPSSLNFLNMFMNAFAETNNVLGTDFKLYSTLTDALADTNEWQYCSFNDQGFPGDCGPEDHATCMWNTYESWQCGQSYNAQSHAFYVQD